MNQFRIVAVETSSRVGSVALAQGDRVLGERQFATQTQHARELLPTLDELCREHGWQPDRIDVCCVSIGPGSFTGLRVAVTFARHLALARGIRIVAVPTLSVIAENALSVSSPPSPLAVVLDAKRGQVFAGAFEYEVDRYHATIGPCLVEPHDFLSQFGDRVSVMGEGVDYHEDAIRRAGAQLLDRGLWTPRASGVVTVARRMIEEGCFTPPRSLVPFYLRRPEAEEIWEKRFGSK